MSSTSNEYRRVWRQIEIANYISRCDDALRAELELYDGAWPDWLTVPPMPAQSSSLRAAFVHWLDEIRKKSGKPIGVYFETPRDTASREIFPAA